MTNTVDIQHILDFLHCATPHAWVREAAKPENLPILLADHANLEHKAAQSAITAMKRYSHGIPGTPPSKVAKGKRGELAAVESNAGHCYTGDHKLLNKMSRLAREELRHFEQVIALMKKRNMDYLQISASRYAQGLRKELRTQEPGKLVDTLLVGAIIEARSCERFAALVPVLDEELSQFYASLLKSEARHYQDYLGLARDAAGMDDVEQRLSVLLAAEQELIVSADDEFRFHSGPPRSA